MPRNFDFDESYYTTNLKLVASLSRLYSEANQAFLHPRFIEKLFVGATNGKDISRKDSVFDVLVGQPQNIAVGVKTFTMTQTANHKMEKIQEFTSLATKGAFAGKSDKQVVEIVATERNRRIEVDSKIYNIELTDSIYHCLARRPSGATIHEEPYPAIELGAIKPLSKQGMRIARFAKNSGNIYFDDGINRYSYSRAKNVLLKKFDLSQYYNSPAIPLRISENIFEKLQEVFGVVILGRSEDLADILQLDDEVDSKVPGRDFVILPLYSEKNGVKFVSEKSGINQWNASGRKRKYGEAYIRIPNTIHKLCPGFFPNRNSIFSLFLPNTAQPVNAKVCQDNDKALMSNPNDELCKWLYRVIDPKFKDSDFGKSPRRRPYTYKDLDSVGFDSVRVERTSTEARRSTYSIVFVPVGSYEIFLESLSDRESTQ